MKVEPKHIYTGSVNLPKKAQLPGVAKIFKAKAPFSKDAPPLESRVELRKPTKNDRRLTKQVQSLIRKIPTPFLKK